VTPADLKAWTKQMAALPGEVRNAVHSLDDAQLDTPYRDRGWTIRQVVHHIPDSHLNGYLRMKLALTEDDPVIRPYDERAWAELDDSRVLPIAPSLALLEAVHARWVVLIRTLTPGQLGRPFQHPEAGSQIVGRHIGDYAWHGRHHLAHITAAVERHGWPNSGLA
jgi:hypothetical protein